MAREPFFVCDKGPCLIRQMGYEQAMELLVYDTGDEESDDAWLHVSVWKWTYQKSGIGLGGSFNPKQVRDLIC